MLKKLLELVDEKNAIDQNQKWYNGSITYFEWLKDEVLEVEEEMKENNSIHLEDELWDILWGYLNLIEWLTSEWKISSLEKVLERVEKKYTQRIDAIKNQDSDSQKSSSWNEIKKKQKEELAKEHAKKYS